MNATTQPKPDKLMNLEDTSLPGMAAEIHNIELAQKLKSLVTKDKKNFAVIAYSRRTPRTGIVILPAPAVGPLGSTKICDGELTIGDSGIAVTAFRLSSGG